MDDHLKQRRMKLKCDQREALAQLSLTKGCRQNDSTLFIWTLGVFNMLRN